MSDLFPKEGRVVCQATLSYARRQRCRACVEDAELRGYSAEIVRPGSEAHHWPAKGMGGARLRDDHVIPLCRRHHEEAQALRIPASTQDRWVRETVFDFLEESSVEELQEYFAALEVWKDRPLMCPF